MFPDNIYFNGTFTNELASKYLTVYTNCIELEKKALIDEVSSVITPEELVDLEWVIEFGNSFTYGSRKIDEYYFSHALRIARFVYYNIVSENLIATLPPAAGRSGLCSALSAALVHNCFEKDLMSKQEFAQIFGDYYCDAINFITVDRDAMKTSKGIDEHYAKLSKAPDWVLGMRGLDKADNLLILHVNPNEQEKRDYLLEIQNCLIPLLMQSQRTLAAILTDECKWAASNQYEIPSAERLNSMKWSYKPLSSLK